MLSAQALCRRLFRLFGAGVSVRVLHQMWGVDLAENRQRILMRFVLVSDFVLRDWRCGDSQQRMVLRERKKFALLQYRLLLQKSVFSIFSALCF